MWNHNNYGRQIGDNSKCKCNQEKEPFSKKCHIWCHKEYTDKNEKQVGCYVNLDSVETFPDT